MSAHKPANFVSGMQYQAPQPQPSVFTNAASTVNADRAERCASISVPTKPQRHLQSLVTGPGASPVTASVLPKSLTRHPKLKKVPDDVLVSVCVWRQKTARAAPGKAVEIPGATATRDTPVTAEVPLSKLRQIAERSGVVFVDASAAPLPNQRKIGCAHLHKYGKRVLVGIIDVQGFDFSDPNFLHASSSSAHR